MKKDYLPLLSTYAMSTIIVDDNHIVLQQHV